MERKRKAKEYYNKVEKSFSCHMEHSKKQSRPKGQIRRQKSEEIFIVESRLINIIQRKGNLLAYGNDQI